MNLLPGNSKKSPYNELQISSIDIEKKLFSIHKIKSNRILQYEREKCKTIIEYNKRNKLDSSYWESQLVNLILSIEENKNCTQKKEEYFIQIKDELEAEQEMLDKFRFNLSSFNIQRMNERVEILQFELCHLQSELDTNECIIQTERNGFNYIRIINDNKRDLAYTEKIIAKRKDNPFVGYAKYYYSNGDIYEGEFKNKQRDGYGIYYYSNGDIFEGEWKNSFIGGYGIMYFSNGDRFEGEVKNGIINGIGSAFYKGEKKVERGQWKDNNLILGMSIYKNGKMYQGYYNDGKYEGFGILYSKNKIIKIGEWKDGKLARKSYIRMRKKSSCDKSSKRRLSINI